MFPRKKTRRQAGFETATGAGVEEISHEACRQPCVTHAALPDILYPATGLVWRVPAKVIGAIGARHPAQCSPLVLRLPATRLPCFCASPIGNKVIARELGIAEGTVKVHVKHLLRKLNLRSRVEAAVWAVDRRRGE
jgi:hypothetical protein